MDKTKVDELVGRASRAQQLVRDIEALEKADPYQDGVTIIFKYTGSGFGILAGEILKEVVAAGRVAVLERREKELAGVLGETPESPEEEKVCRQITLTE